MERIDQAVGRGADYLVGQQTEDGSLRGGYAAFRDGYSLTPMAMLALSIAPANPARSRALELGRNFLATIVDGKGKLRSDLERPQYPSYSAALSVLALNASPPHRSVRDALIPEIRALQLDESRGISPTDPSYGGWGYEITRPPTANLSATLFSIGALSLSGLPPSDPDLMRARRFVESCQNVPGDGGFFFAPGKSDGNKAAFDGERARSYGSMTADGVRALLRLGTPFDDPRVQAARGWLEKHFDATKNPGEFPPEAEIRRASAYYYYVWSVAHAQRALGAQNWAEPLAEALLARQGSDGSWKNPASEMREDDPLVATSFAMAALAVCRIAITGEYKTHASTGR